MLPELLELILLNLDINTVKSFALSSHYFYKLISKSTWWDQKSKHDSIVLVTQINDIENCDNKAHQHYSTSNKNHYKIHQWIKDYQLALIAKNKAMNTLLVYNIELSMNPNAHIKITFKKKPLLFYNIEYKLCQGMIEMKTTKLIDTVIIIYNDRFEVHCYCEPSSWGTGWKDPGYHLTLLSDLYNDPNAIITNENNQPYINSKTWKIADYLGHIIK